LSEGWQEEVLTITVACDGKSAVDRLNSMKPIKPIKAHYNLLAAIQALWNQIPITSRSQHVKEHQDWYEYGNWTKKQNEWWQLQKQPKVIMKSQKNYQDAQLKGKDLLRTSKDNCTKTSTAQLKIINSQAKSTLR